MKVVFVYPAFSSLALEYLSAVAKKGGHKVGFVFDPCLFNDSFVTNRRLASFFDQSDNVAKQVAEQRPDIIAFSIVTNDMTWFRKVGEKIRNLTSAPIIAGNIHATSAPEHILRLGFVDAAIRGEGEGAFLDILNSLDENGRIDTSIKNLALLSSDDTLHLNPMRPLISDLDTLPFPDKTLFMKTPIRASDIYTIMASRGCPFTCSFCNNDLMKRLYGIKGYVRSRSVDNVISELRRAKKDYSSSHVNFYDEVFGFNKKWLHEFVEKYNREIRLPYIACTNPHVVDDEYASLLHESGCRKVDIGVQTINQEKRRTIYHRTETTEEIRFAIETLKKHKIFVAAENIINFPGETEDDLLEMARFYNETRPDIIKVFWLRYFPGTQIVDIAREHGALSDADVARINSGEDMSSITIDNAAPVVHRQFYFLFVLLQLLPQKTIENVLQKKLYRYFPLFLVSDIAYTFFRIFMRKPEGAEIMMHQHAARYKHYVKKRLFSASKKKD